MGSLMTDGYKTFHVNGLHEQITKVYGNYTNRHDKHSNISNPQFDGVVFLGLQYYIKKYLQEEWNTKFFDKPKEVALNYLETRMKAYLGFDYDTRHFEALYDLGYLPIVIKALPEGSITPYGVAPMTIANTLPDFGWLTLYLETSLSAVLWPMSTSATTALNYLVNTTNMAEETGLPEELIGFMNHDFSMRGMFGIEAGAMSGFAHIAVGNLGSDTLPAIDLAVDYYNADVENELVACSVKATEHSITTSFIQVLAKQQGISEFEAEVEYARKLLQENPTGILSFVSDSYDFWRFVEEGLPLLKDDIEAREGVFVIRPDSGDPVDVLCGSSEGASSAEVNGLIATLDKIFGSTVNEQGYKQLNPKIGAIYGDSITLERQQTIYNRLMENGYVPSVVLGVGSYSYQYVTRDTHGSAIKATAVQIFDEATGEFRWVDVYKDPKTDSKKKSAKGLLRVDKDLFGRWVMTDQCTPEEEAGGALQPVFCDGMLLREQSLSSIRGTVQQELKEQGII